jgi:F-type H+-transporting ATPase subunit a
VTEPKRRGCLGCSFPVVIIVVVVFLGLFVVGFLAGPIGQNLFSSFGVEIDMPDAITVPAPKPHLPAPELFSIGPIPITNTILASFLTVIVLVVISYVVTRRMKLVPGRLQAAFEGLLGWLFDLCKSIAGDVNARRFFPVIATIFLYVFLNAWLSLIPGFGSIELIEHAPIPEHAHIEVIPAEGDKPEHKVVEIDHTEYEVIHVDGKEMIEIEHELIRGANTDVNTPLAIALISFVFVAYFGLKTLGIGWLRQYFNFGPFFRSLGQTLKGKPDFMGLFSGAIDIFVGGLELLSRFITIISFTFRLFGNMTAGEILLLITAFLVPFVLAIPFYGLELLIGGIQAFIFAGLTLVFVTMAVTPHGEESH